MKSRHWGRNHGAGLGLLALGWCALGCSEQEVVAQLRSLSASEDAVFLCRDDLGRGHPFSECPDRDALDDDRAGQRLSVLALVSQTVTDEVAVVDVSKGSVVDVDPSTPGFGFLRVAGRPVAMAATPGGTATFVATADVGRNGIFGLPTSCLGPSATDERQRDLTTWSACRLPQTPGEIAVVVQPEGAASAGVVARGDAACDTRYADEAAMPDTGGCSADLSEDAGPSGRRKLIVSFPDTGELAIIDAQSVLDTRAGLFPDCKIEKLVPLKVEIPAGVTQVLPADLQTQCLEEPAPTAPAPSARAPRPAGFAQAEDKLFVADRAAPVIHVLDTSDVCNLTELPSLLPMSLREPTRVVTTRKVAVSPLTPAGQRFVYAIDSEDQPGASVMVFDASPGSTNLTPLVRPGSPELPGEKPDRLFLDAAARDITFAYRDIPYADPVTGAATFGERCDPDPALDPNAPGALARPSEDLTLGARPGLLRGLFGFILQTNGQIAVVDVDDFDAGCRRPAAVGQAFRGCEADPPGEGFAGLDASNQRLLVSNEVSCRVVQPHRFRSARPVASESLASAARAPSLRGFPQLTLPVSASSSETTDRPRLLAVKYAEGGSLIDADVQVGSNRYSTAGEDADRLVTDPNEQLSELFQSQNTVVLPPLEPRAYPTEDNVSVTYQGSFASHDAGFLDLPPGEENPARAEFRDASLSFCSVGVYDRTLMAEYAVSELGVPAEAAEEFGRLHADYVQITSDFPAADDSYWTGRGDKLTRQACAELFAASDADSLQETRDLRVVSAFADHLVVEPRTANATLAQVKACFPGALKFKIRTEGQWTVLHSGLFRHDVVAGADNACIRSCSPLRKWSKGRVFEISSARGACRAAGEEGDPLTLRVGCAAEDEVACVYDQTAGTGGVDPTRVAPGCVFNSLTERFALYRGRAPSQRDYAFNWQTTGGYAALLISLKAQSSAVSPQSIQYVGQAEQLAVVDGATQGLTLFSLDTFSLVRPSPFY